MGSLLSGSRDDVELVHIETEKLSLMIKGKPFHERYEGLKQYRTLDLHDVMQFDVVGEDLQETQVFDVNEQKLVTSSANRPIFFENGIYQLIVIPKKDDVFTFYHEHPGLRQSVAPVTLGKQTILMGNLQFQNEVGLTTFEIRCNGKPVLAVTLEIFPVKLDYKKDYQKLLEEVNDEIYNLAYHFIRKTYLQAGLTREGKPSLSEFYRLISDHFQQFLHALKRIEKQPHHQLQKVYENARGDQLRKLDSYSRNYMRKQSRLFVEVKDGIEIGNRQLMPTKGLRVRKELTNDTLENRYVKWMMERLIHKLVDLLDNLNRATPFWKQERDEDLIEKIAGMKKQLEGKRKQPFWKRIGRLDRSVTSLVMQMAPGYRDAYQIFLTVSKGLVLRGKLYRMSVKDVALLYEYWTFLKLGQILARKYVMVSQDIVQVRRDGLFVNLETNRQAQRVFRHPVTNEEIVLTYQKYEGSLPTIPQKPDTMLSIEKKGKNHTFNYIFDAKYRVEYAQEGTYYKGRYHSPGSTEEDINTMHRYRDSIVAANNGPYERTAFGAYVLFPWHLESEYQEHHFYKSINEVNIGGLPFLPNATDLVERFVERLIDKNPEELQKEGILPIGALEEWQSSLDEKALVGLVATEEEHHRFVQGSFYSIPVAPLKKGWQEVKYVALYLKNGVASVNGVTVYGKIVKVGLNGNRVQFSVEHWRHLPAVIKPVHYGIAGYMLTTLNMLKEATELPELFMKSKEEMALWRTLRRVSDQIKVDLDEVNVDDATRVKSYQIQDIFIVIEDDEILFLRRGERNSVPQEVLKKSPSSVFKLLAQMLSQ